MKRSPHPRCECAYESRRAGASQARLEKKVPEKGDENGYCFVILINSSGVNIEKSPQERGRKRILVFIQFIDFH